MVRLLLTNGATYFIPDEPYETQRVGQYEVSYYGAGDGDGSSDDDDYGRGSDDDDSGGEGFWFEGEYYGKDDPYAGCQPDNSQDDYNDSENEYDHSYHGCDGRHLGHDGREADKYASDSDDDCIAGSDFVPSVRPR